MWGHETENGNHWQRQDTCNWILSSHRPLHQSAKPFPWERNSCSPASQGVRQLIRRRQNDLRWFTGLSSASTSGLCSRPLAHNLLTSALSSRQVPACFPQGSRFLQDALTRGGLVLSLQDKERKITNHTPLSISYEQHTHIFFYFCMVFIICLSFPFSNQSSLLAWWADCQRISSML